MEGKGEGAATLSTILGAAPIDVALERGASLGRYLILERLGAGAAGTVYSAYDPRLDRRVALKLLRERDPRAQARFVREMRALARLQHRNVVAVYDADEVGGQSFLAMELCPGGTLAEWCAAARRTTDALLGVFLEAGEGLAAAHAAGFVHRDFKPTNVLMGSDGHPRVGDFGLVRMAAESLPGDDHAGAVDGTALTVTASGAQLGTLGYMAREQLRGEMATTASDQFAYCASLYGVLFHERPFAGQDAVGLIAAIERGPKLPPIRSRTEQRIWRVLRRGLAAAPEERFGSMAELLGALRRAGRPPTRIHVAAVGLGVAIMVAGGVTVLRRVPDRSRVLRPRISAESVRRVTITDGCEEFPSFMADGRTLIYDTVIDHGAPGLFAVELEGGRSHSLSRGGWEAGPKISPDGKQVVFKHVEGGQPAICVAPADVREPWRKLDNGIIQGEIAQPSWSRDGTAVWAGTADVPVLRDASTSAELRRLHAPKGVRLRSVIDLGNGRVAAVAWKMGGQGGAGIVLFERDGTYRWLLEGRVTNALVEIPGDALLAGRWTVGGVDLWRLPLDGGEPEPVVANGVAPILGLAISPDHRHLAWSSCDVTSEVVVLERNDRGMAPKPLWNTKWDNLGPAGVPGRDQVVVVSPRSGSNQLWVIDSDGAHQRMIDTGGLDPGRPAVSWDARFIAFPAIASGGIYVVSLAGGSAHALTRESGDGRPTFSRDGRMVYFQRVTPGHVKVMRVPFDGGEPVTVAEGGATPVPSPTDDIVAYVRVSGNVSTPMLYDVATARSREVAAGVQSPGFSALAFSPDGQRLVLRDSDEVVEIDLHTNAVAHHRLLDGSTEGLTFLGDKLLAWHSHAAGNLWTADVEFSR